MARRRHRGGDRPPSVIAVAAALPGGDPLAMALAAEGCPAISYTGSQVGIITDTSHRKAKIVEVKGDRVRQSLAEGKVCVIAGFQGVSTDKEITTMGRGASDLTASALAQAMDADACEIYTDVTGVFTADPRIVPQARKLAHEAGYAGAMFPWQSSANGREETQTLHLNPNSGRWLPDESHRLLAEHADQDDGEGRKVLEVVHQAGDCPVEAV